jgi:hypothetical protein
LIFVDFINSFAKFEVESIFKLIGGIMKSKLKIILAGLFLSGNAFANCPHHDTVIYKCVTFENNQECTWNPIQGWYQGSSSHGADISEGARATRFLRAFWTPNAHITGLNKVSFGVTICQYSYHGNLIELYQKDRDINIPDPRLKNKEIWSLEEWQGVRGFGCSLGEGKCHFEYGERM